MQIMAQLYNQASGQRTEPVAADRRELANKMKEMPKLQDAVVIVLMERPDDSEEWQFTTAPLIHALEFIDFFGDKDHG